MAHIRHKKLKFDKIVIPLFLHVFGYSLFPSLFTCNTKNFTTSIPSGCWWHVLIKDYRWFKLKHMIVQYWDTFKNQLVDIEINFIVISVHCWLLLHFLTKNTLVLMGSFQSVYFEDMFQTFISARRNICMDTVTIGTLS